MDTDIHRSTPIPATVTISSDNEPVETRGFFCELVGGFVLEFGIGGDKYTITHMGEETTFECVGVQAYSIVLRKEVYRSMLKTPFGDLPFSVRDSAFSAVTTDDAISLDIGYVLSIDGAADDVRKIRIAARFIKSGEEK